MAHLSASRRARAMADKNNRNSVGESYIIPTVRSRSSMVFVPARGKTGVNVRPVRGLNSRNESSGKD